MIRLALFHSLLLAGTAAAQDCSALVARYRLATVQILVEGVNAQTGAVTTAAGSGFVVSPDGYVLTNSHVVLADQSFDQRRITAAAGSAISQRTPLQIVATNPETDLALLKFGDVPAAWTAVAIGSPWNVDAGTPVCSAGYPMNADFITSSGAITGKGAPKGRWFTSLSINAGESGAPVFSLDGKVVAIKVAAAVNASAINMVIPINAAAEQLGIAGIAVPARVIDPASISRECKISRSQNAGSGLSAMTQPYSDVCQAEPGYRITKFEIVRHSENGLSNLNGVLDADGLNVGVNYTLTSGPIYDQKRGWFDGTIMTEQKKR